MNAARFLLALLALSTPLATPVSAAPLVSARVTTAAASPQLLGQIEAIPDRTWAGYALPAAPRRGFFCDWGISRSAHDDLQPLAVFFRVEDHRIERVRLLSANCSLDAERLLWIEHVDAAASLALIRGIIAADAGTPSKQAVDALAMHDDSVDALIGVAKNHRDAKIRGHALFWLGQAAGKKAAGALRDAVDNDPEESVRAKAVFGISNLPDDESIPMLTDLMRTNRSAAVRKKAAFWLGQKGDPRALAAIERFLKD
jgi:hypothetical protein